MMDLLPALALFALGFFVLIKGAQLLIQGASSLARLFGLSSWFIGTVLIGIGTSIPELSIMTASAAEDSQVGIAMLIGSSIMNVLLILGAASVLRPLTFRREWISVDLPLGIAALALAAVFLHVHVLGAAEVAGISREEGSVLIACMLFWISALLRRPSTRGDEVDTKVFSWFASFVLIGIGFLGILFGGVWIVDGARSLAMSAGVSPTFVGLTVLAFGTAIPNFIVTFVAAMRGQMGIAIGSIVGSNIFYFLGITGLAALVEPVLLPQTLTVDIMVAFFVALLFYAFARFGRDTYTLTRTEGFLFVLLYIAYFAFLITRG